MFEITKLDIDGNNLKLFIQTDSPKNDFKISFRLRDNTRWVLIERNQEHLIQPTEKDNGYEVNVNLREFLSIFKNISGKKNVIDLHVNYGLKYENLTISNEAAENIRGSELVNLNSLLNVKYYVIKNQTMAMQLLATDIKATIEDIDIKNDSVTGTFSSTVKGEDCNEYEQNLIIKQRNILSSPNTYIYEFKKELDKSGRFSLDIHTIKENFLIGEKEIFDILVEYKVSNYTLHIPLNLGSLNIKVKKWIKSEDVSFDLIKGKTGHLSIRTSQEKHIVNMIGCSAQESILNIKLKKFCYGPVTIQLRSYMDGMDNKDTILFFEEPVFTENDLLNINLNVKEIFKDFSSNHERKFKIFILAENKLYSLSNTDVNFTFMTEKTLINCYIEDTLIFETKFSKDYTISLAIMGSCFSRAAFNSAEYFNPDYKKYFNVSYSYFWPSIISLVSDPLPFDKGSFKDVLVNLYELEWEFLKSWDKDLKASGAEFLLMDFFVDAMHGVLQLGPNQYLTRNLYTRKTDYYHSTVLKKSKSFDAYDPEYFDVWTKSFDKFVDRIKGIIPEERIVLNLSLLTDKYHDESGGVSSFFNTNHITKSQYLHVNKTWTKMNNYFMTKLPKAKVIDMNSLNYISQYDSPKDLAPCGPHHFESGYYKSIVNELGKVIAISK